MAEAQKAQVLLGDQDASQTMSRLREVASQMSPMDAMRLLQVEGGELEGGVDREEEKGGAEEKFNHYRHPCLAAAH